MTGSRALAVLAAGLLALAPGVAAAPVAYAAAAQPQVVEPDAGAPAPAPLTEDPATLEPAPPATSTQAQPGPEASGARPGRDSGGRDWGLVALAVVGILLLALAAAGLVARWWGWDPPRQRRWRHAVAEAGYRTSLAWAELRDLVRLGR
ncbi:unannotated protein [freshwater metagenome]|uniref:Unannotated protein n=1 Tax=freshwater metagenome TaxID=449393 RepID=A0A6J7JER6_9ZZZZ|nr:hypothetical protein [Actinomycetota bacterium]